MQGQKINFKFIIYILCILLNLFIIFFNYDNFLEKKERETKVISSIKELDEKIKNMEMEKKLKLEEIEKIEEKSNSLIRRLDMINIGDEGEFKRIIYVFAKESGLKLKEISKAEKVWEKGGYRLKYVHFTLYGSLSDFGKFMYLVNKSKKYIDTRKTYIELKADSFKVSLGFIEKAGEKK